VSTASDAKPEGAAGADDPAYAYKPSLIGAPWVFALRPGGIEWQAGRHSGFAPYDRIRRVRLSFRPVTMQSYRFLTEIWSPGNPKIQIASTSWRGMVEQERLDAAYAAFISEFHRRLAAARSPIQCDAGVSSLVYWPGVIVFIVAMGVLMVIAVRALLNAQWIGAAMIVILFLMFSWQLGNHFRRNWPMRYRPDAVPPQVLPRV
jgi:hypothetical protein